MTDPKGNNPNCGDCSRWGRFWCKWELVPSSSKVSSVICFLGVWPCHTMCPYICYKVYDLAWKQCKYKGKVCASKGVPGDWILQDLYVFNVKFGYWAPIVVTFPPDEFPPYGPWPPPHDNII